MYLRSAWRKVKLSMNFNYEGEQKNEQKNS